MGPGTPLPPPPGPGEGGGWAAAGAVLGAICFPPSGARRRRSCAPVVRGSLTRPPGVSPAGPVLGVCLTGLVRSILQVCVSTLFSCACVYAQLKSTTKKAGILRLTGLVRRILQRAFSAHTLDAAGAGHEGARAAAGRGGPSGASRQPRAPPTSAGGGHRPVDIPHGLGGTRRPGRRAMPRPTLFAPPPTPEKLRNHREKKRSKFNNGPACGHQITFSCVAVAGE